jgi:hypothetical protein
MPRVVILRCPRASHNPERATTARGPRRMRRGPGLSHQPRVYPRLESKRTSPLQPTCDGSARKPPRRAPQGDGSRDGVCDAVRLARPTLARTGIDGTLGAHDHALSPSFTGSDPFGVRRMRYDSSNIIVGVLCTKLPFLRNAEVRGGRASISRWGPCRRKREAGRHERRPPRPWPSGPSGDGRASANSTSGLLGRRAAIAPLGHELVELFLVLGHAQPTQELAEFTLLFFQPL